ncbi:TylF/MycF family methyltransferase [Spirillospora sp. NPDC049652]
MTDLYLDLMKKVLTNVIYRDPPIMAFEYDERGGRATEDARADGRDWPSVAHTMVGLKRLDNIQHCLEQVIADGVPGDVIETGVWRGGASIFARAVLRAHGVTDRTVWLADSFEGMPEVDRDRYPGDHAMNLHKCNDVLGVPLATVQRNFATYGLLDDQVRFLRGWFRDTLPTAPVERLAVLRLDGDFYESTMDALVHLYPKLSPGGFAIIDDYLLPGCRNAVHDYRAEHGIDDELIDIDGVGAYWRRTAAVASRVA